MNAEEKANSKIKVLIKEPNAAPRIAEIEYDEDMRGIKAAIGGNPYVESSHAFPDCRLLFDEEGKMEHKRLPYNLTLTIKAKNALCTQHFVGTVLLVATAYNEDEEEEFTSLTDEQADKYMKLFSHNPVLCEQER